MEKTPGNSRYLIGIDEVGRGPLAGPVAVCAFLIKDESFLTNYIGPSYVKLPKLKDSKKLSKKQRKEWFDYLKVAKTEGLCDFAISFVSSVNIDKFGIAKCIQKALDESLKKVTSQELKNSSSLLYDSCYVFLDGGLHAREEYIHQETIIKGDELYPVISMASIIAKVARDRVMEQYAKEYREYGFEKHVGYGTRAHYLAIKTHGLTPIHRKTFIH